MWNKNQETYDQKEKEAREDICDHLKRVIKLSEDGEISFVTFKIEMELIYKLLDMRDGELDYLRNCLGL